MGETGDTPAEPLLADVSRQLLDYLEGCMIDFSSIAINGGTVSPFQSSVLGAARRIPYGAVWSYAELANHAGYPKAVRATASVMRDNRFPLVVPCHRVIRSNGAPGAYCGDRDGEDAALKKALLQLERCSLKKRSGNRLSACS